MMNPEKLVLCLLSLMISYSAVAAELTGVVAWPGMAKMGFVVTGSIDSNKVQPGARVSKGQLLVQLEQQPFDLEVKKFKAATETIEPLLFDAAIELSQAEELYERTVLSQIELQKIEARHRGLQAQSRVASMDYELAKWRLHKSSLLAPFDGVVIENQFTQGQVIGEENKTDISLSLVPVGIMAVKVSVGEEALSALPLGHEVKVVIGSDEWPGVVRSRDLHGDEKGQYRSVIEFKYPQDKAYYSGQNAKVVY